MPQLMAFASIAPSDPFLQIPGRPVQQWCQWHDMFKVYLLAPGASVFSPECHNVLLHSLGPKGQRIFDTLGVSQAEEKREEAKGTTTPVATLAKPFNITCNRVLERN